jgi:acetyl esterase
MSVMSEARRIVVRSVFSLPAPLLRRLAGPPVVVDGTTLDLEMQVILKFQGLEGPPVETQPIEQARRQVVRSARLLGGRQPIGAVADRSIDGPAGPIRLRFYTPRGSTGKAPALVYAHGGSFMHGDLDSHDAVCRMLAEDARVRVIAVDYRRAPESTFPAAVDDVWAAWTWVNANAVGLGLDPNRIAVGGDSAGGNLAAVTAQRAVREGAAPAFQLLIYPTTVFGQPTKSRDTYGAGFYLSAEIIELAAASYLADEDASNPLASPLLGDPTGVAPAYVVTAGFDPLHDEGKAYAELMRAAGVDVEYRCEEDLIHAFVNMAGTARSAREALRHISAALERGLARRGRAR